MYLLLISISISISIWWLNYILEIHETTIHQIVIIIYANLIIIIYETPKFSGWGGEDDDFYERLRAKNIEICRFPPDYSQYTMLKHDQEPPSENRLTLLRNGNLRYNIDGLNSLDYKEREVKLHKLFTHILAIT